MALSGTGCLGSSRGIDLFRPPAVLQEDLGEVLEGLTKHGVKRSHGPNGPESPEHKSARHHETLVVEALMPESHDTVESLIAIFL